MSLPSHELKYTSENPPKTAKQSREVIAVLEKAATTSLSALMLRELLYTKARLIFCITDFVEEVDDQLRQEELDALTAIRAQPRDKFSLMYLDARLGELRIEVRQRCQQLLKENDE